MWGPLEESSIECLEERCDGRVAEALVCKFNVVGLGGSCVREASSFIDGVAKGIAYRGAGLWQGVLIAWPSNIMHGDGCSGTIAWYIGALACSTWWLSSLGVCCSTLVDSGVMLGVGRSVVGRVCFVVVAPLPLHLGTHLPMISLPFGS